MPIIDYERLQDIQEKLGLSSVPETIRYIANFILPMLTNIENNLSVQVKTNDYTRER